MSDAQTEFESLVMDQWRLGNRPHELARRIHDELVARPALLARLLGVTCGARLVPLLEHTPVCFLRTGHPGLHEDERGLAWGEALE